LAVAWLSISLIAPMVFAAGAQSNLAACCRRNGQHQCASHHETGSGNGWQTARCPAFPSGKSLPAARHAAAPAAAPAIYAGVVSHPAVQEQTRALGRISYDRSGQKRGPPLFLL